MATLEAATQWRALARRKTHLIGWVAGSSPAMVMEGSGQPTQNRANLTPSFLGRKIMDHLSPRLTIILVVVLVALIVHFIPVVRIVQRTGHSGWWVLLALIPFGSLIGTWILAFGSWPALDSKSG